MRVGIIGAGALGGLFGAKLAASGVETILIDTWFEHVSEINENGLRVHTPNGGRFVARPTARTDAASTEPVDVVIITVKTNATVSALNTAQPLIGTDTIVATFQNGFTAHDIIPERLESGVFVSGTTRHGAQVERPGVIVHDATGKTVVGGNDSASETVADIFAAAGFDIETTKDIRAQLWDKQYISIGVKPTAALTGLTNGELLKSTASTAVLESLIIEANQVREAMEIEPLTSDPIEMVKTFCRENPDHASSALEDVRNHRKTEIEHINGAIAKYGEEVGVPVPNNRLVTHLIAATEERYTSGATRSKG